MKTRVKAYSVLATTKKGVASRSFWRKGDAERAMVRLATQEDVRCVGLWVGSKELAFWHTLHDSLRERGIAPATFPWSSR